MAKLHRRVPRLPHHHLSGAERSKDQASRRPPSLAWRLSISSIERRTKLPGGPPPPLAGEGRGGGRPTRGVLSPPPLLVIRRAARRAASLALALLVVALAPPARAQEAQAEVAASGDPRLVRLEELLGELRSEEEGRRRAAYDALTTLEPEMLPAIRARLARVVRRRPDPPHALEIFNRIRRAAGSQRADDDVDIAPGVLVVLGQDRRERVLQMVEPLLLWRALERMASFESCQAMYPLLAGIDGDLWRWEIRRVVARMGSDIMAAAIAGRGHSDRDVRRWASDTMRRLGADDPGLAVQGLEADQLADVLRAYAMLRMQSAMRVIVSYVDSDRRGVRRAARWAIEQYAGNAIWILRTEYRNQTGQPAPEQWGWRRVADELYAHVDALRMEPVRRAREAGLAALEQGDLAAMRGHFDDVLSRAPDLEDAGPVARGYAALGQARLEDGRLADAAFAYRRALRLAPEDEEAARWRARLAFAEAQQAARAGLIDADRYAEVLALEPDHEGARQALALLEPEAVAVAADGRSRWALLAAALLALLGGALLWRTRDGRGAERVDAEGPTLEAPTFDEADATLAD